MDPTVAAQQQNKDVPQFKLVLVGDGGTGKVRLSSPRFPFNPFPFARFSCLYETTSRIPRLSRLVILVVLACPPAESFSVFVMGRFPKNKGEYS